MLRAPDQGCQGTAGELSLGGMGEELREKGEGRARSYWVRGVEAAARRRAVTATRARRWVESLVFMGPRSVLLPRPPDPRTPASSVAQAEGTLSWRVRPEKSGQLPPPPPHTVSEPTTSSPVEIKCILSPRGKLRQREAGMGFLQRWVGSCPLRPPPSLPTLKCLRALGWRDLCPCYFPETLPRKARGTPGLGRRRPARGGTRPGWGCGRGGGSPDPGRRRGGGRAERGAGLSSPLRPQSPPSGSGNASRAEAGCVGACAAVGGRG